MMFSVTKNVDSSDKLTLIRHVNHVFSQISIPAVRPNKPINPLNAELNPICYLLALLGAHHFLHVSRIRVKCAPVAISPW